jgi:hypothetical protein
MEGSRKRPSPAFVIACLALFLALTNTAIGKKKNSGGSGVPANSVGSKQLKDDAVKAADIAPAAVTTSEIAPGAVTSSDIKTEAVLSSSIAPGAVTTSDLGNGSVTGGKIKDDSVISANLASSAVTTVDLAPGAVTASKIGTEAVTSQKIMSGSVGTQQMSAAIPSAMGQNIVGASWPAGGTTVFHFPTPVYDTADLHDHATHQGNTRMTAPVDGVYQVTASVVWANDGSGGTRAIEFVGREADGTTPFGTPYFSKIPANSGITTPQTLTGIVALTAGQSVELWGGASVATDSVDAPPASLAMTWVAPGSF